MQNFNFCLCRIFIFWLLKNFFVNFFFCLFIVVDKVGFVEVVLVGLVSKENFVRVLLRKIGEFGMGLFFRFDSYKDLMLIYVKGRRKV